MDVPQDKEDIQLYEYHGMADIYDQLLKMNGDGPKNGWATLGCLQGIDAVCEKISRSVDTISIVAGLLLSASINLIAAPPDIILQLEQYSYIRLGYVSAEIISITCHFTSIILNSLLVNALNTSATTADKFRILLRFHRLPSFSYSLFSMGNFMLAFAISTLITQNFGIYVGIASFVLMSGLSGVITLLMNSLFLLPQGHVVQRFLRESPTGHIEALKSRYEAVANLDRRKRQEAKPKPLRAWSIAVNQSVRMRSAKATESEV